MTAPEVSVTLITRNRADKVATFLERAASLRTEKPWELVVVDNGSTDETPALLARARDTFPAPVRLVEDATPGVARARNRGWMAATAPIVAYVDDDCYPAQDFVDRVLTIFDANQELGYVGGAVLPHDERSANIGIIRRREPIALRPGMFITVGTVITANLAFRKRALEDIGGFDEAFAYGAGLAGEDADAVIRASAAGWHGRYDPLLVVWHDHRRRHAEELTRVERSYAVGRGAVYAKCLFDPRVRWLYLKGWTKITLERLVRDHTLTPTLRELVGAARYVAQRLRAS